MNAMFLFMSKLVVHINNTSEWVIVFACILFLSKFSKTALIIPQSAILNKVKSLSSEVLFAFPHLK